MSRKQEFLSLALSLTVILIIAGWPLATHRAADRETAFTILRAVILALSLNILLGYTGYVSFGHIVFFGLGGYVGMFLITAKGWSIWTAMLASGLASGLLALAIGTAILRLRGAYFALVTIGLNEVVRAFVNNFAPFGGPIGMTVNFKIYNAYGGAAQMLQMAFYIVVALAVVVTLVNFFVRTSRFGLGLLAIREDEDAAEVMGVRAPQAKTIAYVLSAIFPGILGALFFFKNGSIEPHDAFPLATSIETIVMVMLGGYGTVIGPILGATGYQAMRTFLLTNPLLKNIQLTVTGFLLLIIVLFIPAGFVGWLRHRFPKMRRVLV